MKIVALAGGVGGAKLVDGLARITCPDDLTIIVNTGDDFEYYGMYICPDLDTICYTLAGIANPITGWGRENDTFRTLAELTYLQGLQWFRLGDKDLALQLERTRLLKQGLSLTQITRQFLSRWRVQHTVLPMSNEPCPTYIVTKDGQKLPFQEYFVKLQCAPEVKGFEFPKSAAAKPGESILDCIERCDVVVLCPSNPFVSIDPILRIRKIKEAISRKKVIAISPIIAGKALKGPAAKMYADRGIDPSAYAIAKHYQGLITGLMIDKSDASQKGWIDQCGIILKVTDIVMRDQKDRIRLAKETVLFATQLILG